MAQAQVTGKRERAAKFSDEPSAPHSVVMALLVKTAPMCRSMQAAVVMAMALLMVAAECSMVDAQLMVPNGAIEFGAAGGAWDLPMDCSLNRCCREFEAWSPGDCDDSSSGLGDDEARAEVDGLEKTWPM